MRLSAALSLAILLICVPARADEVRPDCSKWVLEQPLAPQVFFQQDGDVTHLYEAKEMGIVKYRHPQTGKRCVEYRFDDNKTLLATVETEPGAFDLWILNSLGGYTRFQHVLIDIRFSLVPDPDLGPFAVKLIVMEIFLSDEKHPDRLIHAFRMTLGVDPPGSNA